MSLTDVGNLMCLPLDEIEPGIPTEAHSFIVKSAAVKLRETGRNWIPIVVKETGVDQYEVIGNSFIYAVAIEAGLNEVWCIIADDKPETVLVTQALAQEQVLKTNLSTATRDEISAALDYLISMPPQPLKGVNLASAVNRIDAAPRQYWKNFQPVTQLKCGITAGKKLKALEQVFYLEPQPLPEIITDRSLLESFNKTELLGMAKKRGLKELSSKSSKSDLIKLLASQ